MKLSNIKEQLNKHCPATGCLKTDGDWQFLMEDSGVIAHNKETHDMYHITWSDIRALTELIDR